MIILCYSSIEAIRRSIDIRKLEYLLKIDRSINSCLVQFYKKKIKHSSSEFSQSTDLRHVIYGKLWHQPETIWTNQIAEKLRGIWTLAQRGFSYTNITGWQQVFYFIAALYLDRIVRILVLCLCSYLVWKLYFYDNIRNRDLCSR